VFANASVRGIRLEGATAYGGVLKDGKEL
jgi:hypothetical protein